MKFIKPYEGRLDSRMLKEGRLKDAYTSLRGQRYRCNNKNSEDYKWYGAKGIKVIYPTRYFIGWYLKEAKRFKKGEKISIDRIDHNGNYMFNNIRLVTRSENSREMARRLRSIDITLYSPDNIKLATFKDSIVAENLTKYKGENIRHCVRVSGLLRDGYYFRRTNGKQ